MAVEMAENRKIGVWCAWFFDERGRHTQMDRETLRSDERESKKKRRTRNAARGVGLVLFCLAMASIGGSFAYFSKAGTLTNMMGTKSSAVSLNENFNSASTFLPGETVTKQVYLRNAGEEALVLRVKDPEGTEYWADMQGRKLSGLGTEKVIKNWTEYWWNDSDSEHDECEWTKITTKTGDKEESYYYYKKILPVGGKTNPILDSVKLSPEVSNDRHDTDYSDKQYVIDFQAEAIPYYEESGNQGEIEDAWGVSCTVDSSGDVTWQTKSVT